MTDQTDRRSWDAALASAASDAGWKTAGGGTIYRSTNEYVFELRAPAPRKGKTQHGSLLAKPLALDPVFWEITGSPELLRKRLAFRVNGAFTVPLISIEDTTYTNESAPAKVLGDLDNSFLQAKPAFQTLEDFRPLIDAHGPPRNGQHLATRITWLIAVGQVDEARRVLRAGIASKLDGGFRFPAGTFEDLALDHLGLEHERGHHVELMDGRFRRIFPGSRWTSSARLAMDLNRMNGTKRFALALWRVPESADRCVLDDRWDAEEYVQCAGGPDCFVIELRRLRGDQLEQVVVGHPDTHLSGTVDVVRGKHTSRVHASETFTRDETLDIMLHFVEHDTIPDRFTTRPIDPQGNQSALGYPDRR